MGSRKTVKMIGAIVEDFEEDIEEYADWLSGAEGIFRRGRTASQDSISSAKEAEEGFRFAEKSHSDEVLSGLNSMRLSGLFCDVTLSAQGEDFPCHKMVLASFSPYFKAMFTGQMFERHQDNVTIISVSASLMKSLLDYAYTSEILITDDNVQGLLSSSNLLQILPVRDACCGYMERHMDETNCLGINCLAEAYDCAQLRDTAKAYALKHFARVMHQDEFLHMTACKIIEVISDDGLVVEREEEVFEAVARWYDGNCGDYHHRRVRDFHKIVEQVRLPLLSPYYLYDRVANFPAVKQCPKCLELLEEAKAYHLLPDRRSELQSPRTRCRKSSDVVSVIVTVGGEDDKVVLRSVESFDPRTLQWRTLACLPFAISKHGLVVSGSNLLYMAGGEFPDGSASRNMLKYDPLLDVWQEMAKMNLPRSELGLAMLDGYIYAVGGWEGNYRLDSVERYDPRSNTWHFVSPMKLALTSPAVVACGGCLYVTGGAILEDGDGIEMVQRYDPKEDAWTEVAPMLIARSGSAACLLSNLVYVIGGWQALTENTSKVESYDPVKNEWRSRAPMNERRYRPGVSVVDGKIYVCGGEEGWDRYHDTIECYDEERDAWEIVSEMPTSRSWLSCVVLQVTKEGAKEKS